MKEQERDEWQALRQALARLAHQLYEATHALRSLRTCLQDSASAYHEHGAPFGTSVGAVRIWMTYRQYTTSN